LQSTERSFSSVVLLMTLVTIISKLLGFVREQMVAHSFGVTAVSDAYFTAQFIPTTIDYVIGTAVATVLVPLLTSARDTDGRTLNQLISTVLLCIGLVYTLEAGVIWLAAPTVLPMLVPGLNAAATAQGISLVRIFAPSVVLMGLCSITTSLLHVHGRFVWPAVAALSANASIIVVVIINRGNVVPSQLAWAVVLGYGIQAVLLTTIIRSGQLVRPALSVDFQVLKNVIGLALPLMLANSAGLLVQVVDKSLASQLAEGSIAALNYALRLVQLPVGVAVTGLSTVLFARFSQLSADGARSKLTDEVGISLRGVLFLILPVVVVMTVLAEPIVSVAFQRGQFDEEAVRATSGALRYYSVGLAPLVLLPVATKVLYSLKNTRYQLVSGFSAAGTYTVAAWLLIKPGAHQGLALAYALGQFVALVVIMLALLRKLGPQPLIAVGRSLPITGIATVLAIVAALISRRLEASSLVSLVLGCIMSFGTYFGVHFLVQSPEIKWTVRLLRGRSGRAVQPGQP
jgi:putative peptidoglycan lipid II flippase